MTGYKRFCERYELDPSTPEAREQYRVAQESLAALHGAAATAEAGEAIDRARDASRGGGIAGGSSHGEPRG